MIALARRAARAATTGGPEQARREWWLNERDRSTPSLAALPFIRRMNAASAIHPDAAAVALQRRLVANMLRSARHGDPGAQLIETHISWVLLAGDSAWKIKKPLDLGFLDFSTLALRRHFCEEELRLNRRYAPQLYLSVLSIIGSVDQPRWGAEGEAIEYALQMRRFDQNALFDRMFGDGRLAPAHIDALAGEVARAHGAAARAAPATAFGTPAAIAAPAIENFHELSAVLTDTAARSSAAGLARWTRAAHTRLSARFAQRRADGFVRECHGDLHLGNVALIDGRPTLFDCIEFDPNLRWIDVANEIAFAVMDLAARGRDDLAARFLNAYLEHTGDYDALATQAYYQVYRAVVRAKIAAIRGAQTHLPTGQRSAAQADCMAHLRLAERLGRSRRGALVITHGLSGAGKTTVAGWLVDAFGAVRLRSDVERKRMFGVAAASSAVADPGRGIYTADVTQRTYDRLLGLACVVIDAGRIAVVDASFLDAAQRARFRQLAVRHSVAFVLLDLQADEASLRARLLARRGDASDATPALLAAQLREFRPLAGGERDQAIVIDVAKAQREVLLARLAAALPAGD